MGLEQKSIISVLSKGFNRELTINQISKSIKKSYAFTNQHAHDLIKKEILAKKVVGSAILCFLNLKNEETIAHLIFNSINAKKIFVEELNEQKKIALEEFLSKNEDKCIFLEKNNITIISENKENNETKTANTKMAGYNISIINKSELEKKAKNIDFENLTILNNHESFWRMIKKIAE